MKNLASDDAIESVAGHSMHTERKVQRLDENRNTYGTASTSEGHANKTVWLRLYKPVP